MTKHWQDSLADYLTYFNLISVILRGCRTYTKKKVLRSADQGSLKVQTHDLCNHLPIKSTDEQTAFTSVLRDWREKQRHKTSPSSGTLWVSKNLSEHLNLAVNTPRPASITHQAFFMEAGLPALLITVCKSDLGKAGEEEVHRYAVELLQHHSRMMKDFCPHPFIVLPLTMKAEDLTAEEIERKIKDETDRASYYTGPGDLSEAAYKSLKDGMEAASAGTMMPHFLQDSESEPEWILQLPSEWRNLLYTFIEFMKEGTGHVQHECFHGSFQAVKIAILEALRRVSFTKGVEVETTDESIKTCIKKSAQHTMKSQGSEEQWVSCPHPMSGGITVSLSTDFISLERHSQASNEADPDSIEEKLKPAFIKITCNSSLFPKGNKDLDSAAFNHDLQKIKELINLALPSNRAAKIEARLSVTGEDKETKLPSRQLHYSTLPSADDQRRMQSSCEDVWIRSELGTIQLENSITQLTKQIERLEASQISDVSRSVSEGEQVGSPAQPVFGLRQTSDWGMGPMATCRDIEINDASPRQEQTCGGTAGGFHSLRRLEIAIRQYRSNDKKNVPVG